LRSEKLLKKNKSLAPVPLGYNRYPHKESLLSSFIRFKDGLDRQGPGHTG